MPLIGRKEYWVYGDSPSHMADLAAKLPEGSSHDEISVIEADNTA
jgi:hypothetical protein